MRHPVRKEFVQFNGGIAEPPVDLLDTVFAQRSAGVGQSLSNRMDGQGGTGQHSERTVGERQDPLGMQVAIVQLGDEGNQMLFAKYVSGFHYPPSEMKADILFPFSNPYKSEATLAGKGGAKYSRDLTHRRCEMRTRNQKSLLSSC